MSPLNKIHPIWTGRTAERIMQPKCQPCYEELDESDVVHLGPAHLPHTQTCTHLSLEGAVEGCEEVRARGERQDPPLHQSALGVLVLEENVFFQDLNCKQTLAASLLCQQHLCSNRERRESYLGMNDR